MGMGSGGGRRQVLKYLSAATVGGVAGVITARYLFPIEVIEEVTKTVTETEKEATTVEAPTTITRTVTETYTPLTETLPNTMTKTITETYTIPTRTTTSNILWEDDFKSISAWQGPNDDKSVNVCDNSFPKQPSDYGVEIVVDQTSPSDDKNVVKIISNKTRRGGFYGNMNIYRPAPFFNGSRYLFYGYFRKGTEGQPQAITASIELIEDYTEHYAELLWILNPYADEPSGAKYGSVITRGEEGRVIPLINIGDDNRWHYFEIQTRYDIENGIYLNERVRVDDRDFPLNIQLGTFPKWWKSSFGVALQVANQYTNCDQNIITIGTAMFDKVGIKRLL
jgi:hypothetical protein